ncbi:MAG: polyprenyl synthetase family protein [Xanthomonadales bacterium]|nr:polyprenyl synthetase family protein [Xanthomonadales bacterium]
MAALTERVNRVLDTSLPDQTSEPRRLHEAMAYSVTAGGKRVRPLLAYGAGEALGLTEAIIDPIAAALEFIHAYSLIHDDLPAMDDDDMRRGKPTCHIAFGEATAILAGDALQALAFEILAKIDHDRRGALLVSALAQACGSRGMAGGQAIDLESVGTSLDLAGLKHMHALKTGALISAAVTMPGLLAEAPAEQLDALKRYGDNVGLAFQIKDDILDVEGETELIGKRRGADQALNKPTFPALLGLNESRTLAGELLDSSLSELEALPGDTRLLAHLARFIIERNH